MDKIRFAWIVVLFTAISTNALSFNSKWDTGHINSNSNNPNTGQIAHNPCGRDGEGHAKSSGSEQGSPVELTNGALVWHETDIVVAGRFPLTLSRTYSSNEVSVGMFGKGWVANCERSLVKAQNYSSNIDQGGNFLYLLRLSNGKRFKFGDENSNTTPPPGLWAEISEQGDTTALKWRNGRVDTYGDGLLIKEQDGYGNSINYSYTDKRLTELSTSDGRWIKFTYDTENWVVVKAQDNTGRSWYYQYNEYMELTSVRSPRGTRHYTYYGEEDLPPVGGFAKAYSFLSSVTDETGVQVLSVDYIFDSFENLGRVSSYTEGLISYSYEYIWGTFGTFNSRVVSVNKSGNGKTTIYTLNEDGQISGESGDHGSVTYDRNKEFQSEVTSVPTGYTINTTYDDRGRPTSISNGRGTTTYTYSNEHQTPTRITLPKDFGSFNYVLNAQGDVISAQDPAKNTYSISRNGLGDITQITLPGGTKHWKFTYNGYGLVQTVENPMGQTVQYIRDNWGNILRHISAAGTEWTFTYDALGRKLSETSPAGAVTTYSYDAAGRQTEAVSDSGEIFSYYYDEYGRLIRENNFWGVDTTYTYVPGTYRLATVTDPNGNVTSYSYNDKNELTTKQTSDQTIRYIYDDNGRLLSIANGHQTIGFQYNPYSEITRRTIGDKQFSYSYDAMGRLNGFTTPVGIFSYSYNALGLQSKVSSPAGDFNYQYDIYGRLTHLSRPNGVNTDYGYDDADRILSIAHGSIGSFGYEYDLNDRITKKTGFGNTVNYDYDNDSRLISAAYSSPLSDGTTNEIFSYDLLGNRLDNGSAYISGNRVESDNDFTYEYNLNGNRTKRENRATGAYELYTYSNWNQLIRYQRYASAEDADPEIDAAYLYGPEGQRIKKSVNGVAKNFLWNGTELVAEISGDSERYYFSSLVIDGADYLFPLEDHLSVITAIANQSGVITWSGIYKAFGQMQIENHLIEWNKRFPGQYYDNESGLHYNLARDYDPSLGRYVQSDPIGLGGGINTFSYVQSNPVTLIDALGLCDNPFGLSAYVEPLDQEFAERQARQNEMVMDILMLMSIPIGGVEVAASRGLLAEGGTLLFRRGAYDSTKLLQKQALAAEEVLGIHGVSVSASSAARAGQVVRCATCSSLEEAGFNIIKTGRDPNHYTVQLPKPITKEVSEIWNALFK